MIDFTPQVYFLKRYFSPVSIITINEATLMLTHKFVNDYRNIIILLFVQEGQ